MFVYDKKLQYPVKVARPNPRLASVIISQYGGPDGELGASLRYLSQRYSMPFDELKGLLTDIGNGYGKRHPLRYRSKCHTAGIFFSRSVTWPPLWTVIDSRIVLRNISDTRWQDRISSAIFSH